MRRAAIIAGTVAGSAVYATVRYNVFGGVPWGNWPAYVGNKAICLSVVIFLLLAAIQRRGDNLASGLAWAQTAFHGMVLHVLLSLTLLSPWYFKKAFFTDERMNLNGEIMLLAGVSAAYVFYRVGRAQSEQTRYRLTMGALSLLVVHLVFVGYPTWLAPGEWYAGMPPVSLLSAVLAVSSLALHVRLPQRVGRLTGGD